MSEVLSLEIHQLRAGYGGRPVLDGVSLLVGKGERLALIGPNGCGKSTLLRAVTAEVVESGGTIRHDGREISKWGTDRIIRGGVGYLRQSRNLFSSLTVGENLRLASWNGGLDKALLVQSFPALKDRFHVRAGLLSGGERQTLAVAMAISGNATLLLLDEPLAGLSPKNASGILDGVFRLQRDMGFAVVMVEHRLRLIRPHIDRVVIMVRGAIKVDTIDTTILEDRSRLEQYYLL